MDYKLDATELILIYCWVSFFKQEDTDGFQETADLLKGRGELNMR